MKYAKTSYFVPVDYIGVVGTQVENLEVIRMKNNRVVPKEGVIKGYNKGCVIKGV